MHWPGVFRRAPQGRRYAVNLSVDQEHAVEAILAWLDRADAPRFVFGGLAGTGKTTIVSYIVETLESSGHVVFVAAPTGKAAHVLRQKGVDATTLHSLIYESRYTAKGWKHTLRESLPDCDLLIIDEASMLSRQLVRDAESFGVPVLYVGDHGQLEPVGDDPEIMRSCDVKLETIHRQAEGSSIIRFAHAMRSGLPGRPYAGNEVELAPAFVRRHLREADVVICGFRRTRVQLNAAIRNVRGFAGPDPLVGETVICLANAKIDKGPSEGEQIFNGLCGRVLRVDRQRRTMVVLADDERELTVRYYATQFGAEATADPRVAGTDTLWDWGYAITCHKSQGAQWSTVAVLDETHPDWSLSRWRYTAATRASERLVWVKP